MCATIPTAPTGEVSEQSHFHVYRSNKRVSFQNDWPHQGSECTLPKILSSRDIIRDAQNCSCLGWYAPVTKWQMGQNTLCMRFCPNFFFGIWTDCSSLWRSSRFQLLHIWFSFPYLFGLVCLSLSGYSGEISYLHLNSETTWPSSIVSQIRRTGHLLHLLPVI